MKALFKSLTWTIIFVVVTGFCLGVYILQAPPVEQSKISKIQIHTRTALRSRPTVNSKPIAYTKDVFRFGLTPKYISNLNSGTLSAELLFNAELGHRAAFKAERLDEALKTGIDWQKMFTKLTKNVRFDSHSYTLDVLLKGQEWFLTDGAGAGYTVVRTQNRVGIYLPNLKEIFEVNNVYLSEKTRTSIQKSGRQWLIKDIDYKQAYVIKLEGQKGRKKLNVYQQSKYEILELLFDVKLSLKPALEESLLSVRPERAGAIPAGLYELFAEKKISLSRKSTLSGTEPGISWLITDSPQKYRLRRHHGRLKSYVELESKWLQIRVNEEMKGWVQRESGTVFRPALSQLSSRQAAKQRLLTLVEKWKGKIRR